SLVGKDGGIHRWAYPEQQALVEALSLPFTHVQLVLLARLESFIVRKIILEKVRARADIGGYVITGLRDTPITTSGIFDDQGYFKYVGIEENFIEFNAPACCCSIPGARASGRTAATAPHRSTSSIICRARWCATALSSAASHSKFNDAALVAASHRCDCGEGDIPVQADDGLQPRNIVSIDLRLPEVETITLCTLDVELSSDNKFVQNGWPLWVYPHVTFEDAVLYDPAGALDGYAPIRGVASLSDLGERIVITSAYTSDIAAFVRQGGRAIVIQTGAGVLPVERVPFWREAIKLPYTHPVIDGFGDAGGLQFYHLATDAAFKPAEVESTIGAPLTPILRRLDARLFTVTDYLAEASIGVGRLMISTLRFAGGTGDQVVGFASSPAAMYLLSRMIAHLRG
ncbi:MAG: hypothetical protein HC828_10270, partial [Blastochloris sp.]|nr:hypothetical protein [Blastochloris sp.]